MSWVECPACFSKAIAHTYDGRKYCVVCASKKSNDKRR
jgi:hypothetical protein